MIKRKEFQQRKLAGACVTEAETNANDRAELKGRKEKKVFPPTAMIWTTIRRTRPELRDLAALAHVRRLRATKQQIRTNRYFECTAGR